MIWTSEPIRSWLREARGWLDEFAVLSTQSGTGSGGSDDYSESLGALAFRVSSLLGQSMDAARVISELGLVQSESGQPPWKSWVELRRADWRKFALDTFRQRAGVISTLDLTTDYRGLFYAAAELRRLISAARHLDVLRADTGDEVFRHIADASQHLALADRRAFERSIRRLLSDYYLYPFADSVRSTAYRGFFQLGSVGDQGGNMFGRDIHQDLHDALTTEGIVDSALLETVVTILDRLAEIGDVDEDRLEESLGGRHIFGRASDRVMVIPGLEDGECRPILLARCNSKSRRSTFKHKPVFDEVRKTLIKCTGCVKVIILVADIKAMSKAFDDLAPELDTRIRHPGDPLRIFIPVVNVEGKLTVIQRR